MNSSRVGVLGRPPAGRGRPQVALTFDLEEWFQVENLRAAAPRTSWDAFDSRIQKPVERILEVLAECGSLATFFCLGVVAEAHPALVRRIHEEGHEVASHGHGHDLVTQQTPQQFRRDLRESKETLEGILGASVVGYRAPSFSITDWAMTILCETGFEYDASENDVSWHDRYGALSGPERRPWCRPWRHASGLVEVPVFNLRLGGAVIPWGGGAYFRILPGGLFRYGLAWALTRMRDDAIACLYLHPWELDPAQPRLAGVSRTHRLRHYTGLGTTEAKLRSLTSRFGSATLRSVVQGV